MGGAISLPIETERLIVREVASDDLDDMLAYSTDPVVCATVPWGPTTRENLTEVVQGWIAQQTADPRRHWELVMVEKASGQVIGGVSLRTISIDNKAADMGYILHRDWWGRGLTSEATAALMRAGFREAGFHRIVIECDPDNVASRRIPEKLGMRREGHLVKNNLFKGQWRDTLVFALLAEEFTGDAE